MFRTNIEAMVATYVRCYESSQTPISHVSVALNLTSAVQSLVEDSETMGAGKGVCRTRDQSYRSRFTRSRNPAHHCDFDFAGVAKSRAWNFRSTELEDGVERKRRTVFTRRCGVGEIAGWTCGRQANAVIPAD